MTRLVPTIQWLVSSRQVSVMALFAAVATASAVAATSITIDPGFEALMLADDPDLLRNHAMKADFSNDEAFVVAVDFRRPFTSEDLRFVRDLSARLAALDDVAEVLDLATIEDVRGVGDGIDGSPLVDFTKLPGALPAIKDRIREHRLYEKNLVSSDGHVLVLIAIPDYRVERRSLGTELVTQALPIVEAAGTRCDCELYVSGYAMSIWDANRILQRDFAVLGGLALVVVMALNYVLYRRVFAAALTGIVVIWSQLVTAAWFGATGTPITIPTGLVTPMVSAIASTYVIYALGLLASVSETDQPGTELVPELVRPVTLSALSTVAGFLSLNIMPVDGIAALGNALSVAVLASAAGSVVLAPALINRFGWSFGKLPYAAMGRSAMLGIRLARYPRATIAVAAFIVALVGAGLVRLEVETDSLAHWDEDSPFRVAQNFTNDRVGGSQTINVVLRTGKEGGALEPHVMAYANRLIEHLERSETIERTVSFLDYVYLMDAALNPASPPRSVLPSRELAAQYMLLYENGGDPADYRHYINFDRSALNIYGRLSTIRSGPVLRLRQDVREFAKTHEPPGITTEVIGTQILTCKTHDVIAFGMMRGLMVAAVAILLMMIVTLGSIPLALAAMIPNVIPIIMCGGIAGWLGETISISTSIVGCIALGLAVDDTAHVLGHLAPKLELADVYALVGRPLVVTTLSLGVGFAVLGLSEFKAVRSAGIATALTLLCALAADVLLLPSLLEVIGWKRLVGKIPTGQR